MKKLYIICAGIFIFITLSFLSYQTVDISNKIDGSWQYTLSEIRNTQQDIGSSIFYTYGPLFERVAIYPTAKDSVKNYFINTVLVSFLLSGTLFVITSFIKYFDKNKRKTLYLLLLTGFIFLITQPSIDTFYYLLLILGLFSVNKEGNLYKKLFIVAFLSLFSLFKVSFSVVLLLLLPLSLVQFPIKKSGIKKYVSELLLSLSIFCLTFSIISTSSPSGVLRYLYYGVQNASSYTEFMGLRISENLSAVLIFILVYFSAIVTLLVYILFRIRKSKSVLNDHIVYAGLLTLAITYFAFKQSIVRSDFGHLLTFIPFVAINFLLILGIINKMLKIKPKYNYAGISIVVIVTLCLQSWLILTMSPIKSLNNYGMQKIKQFGYTINNNPFSYWSYKNKQKSNSIQIVNQSKSLKNIQDFLNNNFESSQGIIYYGNNTSIGDSIGKFKNITYLPFLQNYAAFPPQTFDSLYVNSLNSKPTDLIIVEEMEPSINERIPSHELNNFFQFVNNNYRLVFKDVEKRLYLLEPVSHITENCEVLDTLISDKSSIIEIPSYKITGSEYIKVKIDGLSGIDELLLSTLFKKPVYSIDLVTPNGNGNNRTTERTLKHGVAVSPFYYSYTDIVNKTPVALSGIKINGGINKNKKSEVVFEKCGFRG